MIISEPYTLTKKGTEGEMENVFTLNLKSLWYLFGIFIPCVAFVISIFGFIFGGTPATGGTTGVVALGAGILITFFSVFIFMPLRFAVVRKNKDIFVQSTGSFFLTQSFRIADTQKPFILATKDRFSLASGQLNLGDECYNLSLVFTVTATDNTQKTTSAQKTIAFLPTAVNAVHRHKMFSEKDVAQIAKHLSLTYKLN